NPQLIVVRKEDNSNPSQYITQEFQLIVNPQPVIPNQPNVVACDSYTLPALPAGQTYHSAPGGNAGTVIPAGTAITSSQVVYIYAASGTVPNCIAEVSFNITINNTPAVPVQPNITACDGYILPALAAGQTYHSAAGGSPATLIPAGTNITATQTIYVFAQTGTVPNCTAEASFTVTINPTPAVPALADVTVCDGYELPALAAGQTYHSAAGGSPATL